MTWTYDASFGDLYDAAMTVDNQVDADAYFARLVEFSVREHGRSPEEAERLHRVNLGYWAGYFDNPTRERVERLFRCEHFVFGSIAKNGPPSPERAFAAGVAMGEKWRWRPNGQPAAPAATEPGMALLLRRYAADSVLVPDDFARALFLDAAEVIEELTAALERASAGRP